MKRQSLVQRIFLPVLASLLLLTPLTCLLFQQAASSYAYTEAAGDLQGLQQEVLPLIQEGFTGLETEEAIAQRLPALLLSAGRMAHRMGGRASLLMLGTDGTLIYPRSETERETVSALAAELDAALQSGTLTADDSSESVEWSRAGGERYLICAFALDGCPGKIRYLITYCPVSQVTERVRSTVWPALALCACFGLPVLAVLWFALQSISSGLGQLTQAARQIGRGTYSELQHPFSIRELEELRLAANEMSSRLRQSEQSQQSFYQNISHELRSPLMSIGGYAQGIEQGIFPDPREAAHTIVEESTRLSGLVNSMLTLSRLERRETRPALSPLPLSEVLGDSLDRAYGQALRRGVSLTLSPSVSGLTVLGEEELLGKLFDNLLSNAVRYASSAVSVEAAVTENGLAAVSVLDDGEGIADADLPRLFERCYRGRGGNFGLGLSIAHQAALLLGGTLCAANRAGGGAVFTATLRLAGGAPAGPHRDGP